MVLLLTVKCKEETRSDVEKADAQMKSKSTEDYINTSLSLLGGYGSSSLEEDSDEDSTDEGMNNMR